MSNIDTIHHKPFNRASRISIHASTAFRIASLGALVFVKLTLEAKGLGGIERLKIVLISLLNF